MAAERLIINNLLSKVKQGNKKSASWLMRMIEDGGPQAGAILSRLYDFSATAHRIGITGWPGVGKSTLVNALAKAYLDEGRRVGIVAVDPTSPYSGGSLLGDRDRFRDVDGHPDLFIRSMATRGYGGGVGKATRGIVKVMEAMGQDVVLLETVGVGQDQVGVSAIVDTTIMVTAPGLGDFLQSLKAGVLEAGEILVVNKADNPNAEQTAADLTALIEMGRHPDGWKPRLVLTVATRGTGIDDLLKSIRDHRLFRQQKGGVNPRHKIAARQEILDMIREQCLNAVACRTGLYTRLPDLVDQVFQGRQDPLRIAQALLKECNLCDDPSEDPSIEDPSGE